MGDHLLDLDGAIIRYLAAAHTSLLASFTDPDGNDPTTDLLYRCTVELRDAAQAVLTEHPR